MASSGWNKGVKSQIRAGFGRPRLGSQKQPDTPVGPDVDQNEAGGVQTAATEVTTSPKEAVTVQTSADHELATTPGAPLTIENAPILEDKTGAERTVPTGIAPANGFRGGENSSNDSSDEDGEIHSPYSGDDGAVMINLEDGGTDDHDREDYAAQLDSRPEDQNRLKRPLPHESSFDGATYHVPSESGSEEGEVSEGEENEYDVGQAESEGDEGEIDEDSSEAMSVSEDEAPHSSSAFGKASAFSVQSDPYSPPPAAATSPGGNASRPIEIMDDDDDIGGDPLMAYASGNPVAHTSQAITTGDNHPPASHERSSHQGTILSKPPNDLTLADVSVTELQLQLRYHHIGKSPTTIALTTLVRCSCCSGHGHLSSSCPERACRHCGAWQWHACTEMHAPVFVPVETQESDLATCKLCSCKGHLTKQCESRWRTSAWPPTRPLPPLSVKLFCYECGGSGHLGNDCPRRRPGKGMGTSAWSRGTISGGVVPVCDDDGVQEAEGAPGPPGGPGKRRRERERREREKKDADAADDGGPLVASDGMPLPKPARSGTIKMGGSIGTARPDLRSGPPPLTDEPARHPLPSHTMPGQGKKNSNKKRKTKPSDGGGGQGFRPMPSSAKKAYIHGRR